MGNRPIPSSNSLPELIRVFNMLGEEVEAIRSGGQQGVTAVAPRPGGSFGNASTTQTATTDTGIIAYYLLVSPSSTNTSAPDVDSDGNCVIAYSKVRVN